VSIVATEFDVVTGGGGFYWLPSMPCYFETGSEGSHPGQLFQQPHDVQSGGFAHIADVLLISQANEQDLCPIHTLLIPVQDSHDSIDTILRHLSVDFTGQFNKTRIVVEHLQFPGQVERIDGNTVSTQTRTREKGHEAKGFGGGSLDDFPDRDSQFFAHDGNFVDQPDVHSPKRVL